MSNAKKTGSIAKIRRLVAVLEKCNGKAAIGGKDALLSPKGIRIMLGVGLLLLIGALFAVFYFVEPLIAPYIPVKAVTQAIMLIMLMISFILSVKNIVTVLYTADDLPVLLPMPLSAGQIVTAKLTVASKFSVILSLILFNSVCLGLGVRAGLGAAFMIGTVLSSILIPVTGIALATLVVVVVFRVFGFIRNRDITMVLGGVFTLALMVAYVIVSNRFTSDKSNEAAFAVFNSIAAISAGIPNISFMTDFMFDGSVLGLLISAGVTVAVAALAMLAVKIFYLSTALSMQNTGSNRRAMTKDALAGKKSSAIKALTGYEAKSTRRNPAYLIYGFAMTFIWPLFIGLPMFFGSNSIFDSLTLPLDMRSAAICAAIFGVTAACYACGFNVLAGTAFSREGDTFSALRAMPIDLRDYYKSKRNFAMLICLFGSAGYVIVLGIVCLAAGVIDFASSWVILYAALISFLIDVVFVNWLLMNNSKKPYFNWDSETEISRKLCWINIVAIILGVIMSIAFMVALAFSSLIKTAGAGQQAGMVTAVTLIAVTAALAAALVLAFAVNRYAVKKGAKNLMELS